MKHYLLPISLGCLALASSVFISGCSERKEDSKTIRFGHFPNVTHVQAMVARNMQRHGNGWFEKRLPGYTFEWYTYNAGPTAMEGILGRSIDMTYVGPSPAINTFSRSKGTEIRIVSGAAEGGVAFVVQPDKEFKSAADFVGTVIATPQVGNTQDISCRAWLADNNFTVTMQGAHYKGEDKSSGEDLDVRLLPAANPEQLPLFQNKTVDAVWTVEPWVTRLETQANAKVFLEEKDVVTTILVARVKWMEENPELVAKIVAAHEELTEWITQNPEEAQKMVIEELEAITQTKVDPELIKGAWKRLVLTNNISVPSLQKFVDDAMRTGFIPETVNVNDMIVRPAKQ